MSTLENKFACLGNLPTLPLLLMDALDQLNGKQDLNILVEKISQDPSMVVRLLRIANSPFYGMPREIGSLREAVVLLGFKRIRDIFVSICFSTILVVPDNGFNFRQLWHHCLAVAECTGQLANLSGQDPDFAFTAGLLHDIGILVIAVLFPEEFSLIVSNSTTPLIETERRILGFDHLEIGSKAAQHWNLPVAIQDAIAQHLTPPQTGDCISLGTLVYSANLLIVKADDSEKLADDLAIYTALRLLDISIKDAQYCCQRGLQFASQIITL